jgi:predicted dithiol-disulfide oxidoreductase (DUF899 family)
LKGGIGHAGQLRPPGDIEKENAVSGITFPNESDAYRKARDELLEAEVALRGQIEKVAAQRRELPPGGELKEDYVFEELIDGKDTPVRFSELFAPGKDTLFLYSFMYGPDMDAACPMCTAIIDALDGQAVHLEQHINFAIVAKHPLDVIHAHAQKRGWSHIRILSSAKNTFNVDYYGEVDGHQMTMANVFVKDGGKVRHYWGSEMAFGPSIEGGNMRHVDLIWPLWNVLDMTPGGRGGDWFPELSYDK